MVVSGHFEVTTIAVSALRITKKVYQPSIRLSRALLQPEPLADQPLQAGFVEQIVG